jgi:hypothetical protein
MKAILFILLLAVCLAATLPGVAMMVNPGCELLQWPHTFLGAALFNTTAILLLCIGLVNLAAVLAQLRHTPGRYDWATSAGMTTAACMIGHIILMNKVHWLHILYLLAGVFIVLIAWQLKGKWVV